MELILPDTNVLILGLANQEPYSSLLQTWIKQKQLVFSPIVVAEFLIGANTQATTAFNQLISQFPTLPIDLQTAEAAAKIRKNHLNQKKNLILPDCLIAAQCQLHHATLATLNPKDFPKTTSLHPLK